MEQDEGHQEEESQGGFSAEKEERGQGVRRGGLDTAQHQKPDTFFFFQKGGNITYVNDGLSAGCCGNHNFQFSG